MLVQAVADAEMVLQSLHGALSSQGQELASFSKQQHEVRDLVLGSKGVFSVQNMKTILIVAIPSSHIK